MQTRTTIAICALLVADWCWTSPALGNGGPFVVKYPGGDPAAKGTVARFDLDLKPGREERLRVVKEDLKIVFARSPFQPDKEPVVPLAAVSAEYTIKNPTDQKIEVDFGFPILRGFYLNPSMMRAPDVEVRLNDKQYLHPTVISNSMIYGLIRQQARETIEKAVAGDAGLAELVAIVRATGLVRQRARATVDAAIRDDAALAKAVTVDPLLTVLVTADPLHNAPAAPTSGLREADHEAARAALAKYLKVTKKWTDADAALMVEFASCDLGNNMKAVAAASPPWVRATQFVGANLGPLRAIGEQKATQFFARLASCCDPNTPTTYEAIFAAWGGDVRERSVDLATGQLRPREIAVDPKGSGNRENPSPGREEASDPTVYARVDYLDPNAGITEAEKASCQTVLKHLPVIFTFAPMNLVHYQASFPPNSTQTLTVRYKQYAYKDTHEPNTYQLAYVLHPASLWKDFGPINLEIAAPQGVPVRASVPCPAAGMEEVDLTNDMDRSGRTAGPKTRCDIYRTTLMEKTGELFVALDAAAWSKAFDTKDEGQKAQQQSSR